MNTKKKYATTELRSQRLMSTKNLVTMELTWKENNRISFLSSNFLFLLFISYLFIYLFYPSLLILFLSSLATFFFPVVYLFNVRRPTDNVDLSGRHSLHYRKHIYRKKKKKKIVISRYIFIFSILRLVACREVKLWPVNV